MSAGDHVYIFLEGSSMSGQTFRVLDSAANAHGTSLFETEEARELASTARLAHSGLDQLPREDFDLAFIRAQVETNRQLLDTIDEELQPMARGFSHRNWQEAVGSSGTVRAIAEILQLNGFDEAIVLAQDGHVSEGSAENLFIVKDGRLVTPAVARLGLGSGTSPILREIVGRRLSTTVSASEICGTRLMMKPTGTELSVVVKVAIPGPAAVGGDCVAWMVKYTRLSTTFSTAVWLLRTLIFGLESTRTSPKDSSSLSAKLKLRLRIAPPKMKALVLMPAGVLAELCPNSRPLEPRPKLGTPTDAALVRSRCQSMPRWYSLFSCTSATVASMSTWRLALVSTWSRNSCTFSCWREVARMLSTPVSGFAITEAASRNVATGTGAGDGAAPALVPGCGAGAVVDGTLVGAALEPAGSTLSVSCRISLIFATSVSQNLFAETELMVAVELFCDPVGVVCPGCVPLTWVARTATLRASRAMLT